MVSKIAFWIQLLLILSSRTVAKKKPEDVWQLIPLDNCQSMSCHPSKRIGKRTLFFSYLVIFPSSTPKSILWRTTLEDTGPKTIFVLLALSFWMTTIILCWQSAVTIWFKERFTYVRDASLLNLASKNSFCLTRSIFFLSHFYWH